MAIDAQYELLAEIYVSPQSKKLGLKWNRGEVQIGFD
jgi:hypothetical protein